MTTPAAAPKIVLPLPRRFAALTRFITNAVAAGKTVYVTIEGERMPLKTVTPEAKFVRLDYGGSGTKGTFSTVLERLWQIDVSGLDGVDEDDEDLSITAEAPVHKAASMGHTPFDQPTEDNIECIGDTYGKLTIVQTLAWKGRQRMVRCQCECGGEKIARLSSLRCGWVVSCGCRRGKNTELPLQPGSTYGSLTILEQVERPADARKPEGHYLVRCVCGKELVRGRESLVTPKKTDCGCGGYPLLAGTRYGKLVILDLSRRRGHHREVGTKCDCGTLSYARLKDLESGRKKSCGCLRSIPPTVEQIISSIPAVMDKK